MITDGNSIYEVARQITSRQARNMKNTDKVAEEKATATENDNVVGDFTKALVDLNGTLYKFAEKSEEEMVGGAINAALRAAFNYTPSTRQSAGQDLDRLQEFVNGGVLQSGLSAYLRTKNPNAEELIVFKNERIAFLRNRSAELNDGDPDTPEARALIKQAISLTEREVKEAIKALPARDATKTVGKFVKYSLTDELVKSISQATKLSTDSKKVKLTNISEDNYDDFRKALIEYKNMFGKVNRVSAPHIKAKLNQLKKILAKLRGLLENVFKSYAGPSGGERGPAPPMRGGACGSCPMEGGYAYRGMGVDKKEIFMMHPVKGLRRNK
tara:strand:- start:57 stop:1037 length:981 start_codon:yes stop_codon:yes gene_type:complete